MKKFIKFLGEMYIGFAVIGVGVAILSVVSGVSINEAINRAAWLTGIMIIGFPALLALFYAGWYFWGGGSAEYHFLGGKMERLHRSQLQKSTIVSTSTMEDELHLGRDPMELLHEVWDARDRAITVGGVINLSVRNLRGDFLYTAQAIHADNQYLYRVGEKVLEINEVEFRRVIDSPRLYYFSTALKLHNLLKLDDRNVQ